jgi:uncharacterized RDD family membrane protein YckC
MTQDLNPYRPPVVHVELAPEAAVGAPLAGKGRRFATLIVDYLGFYALGALVGILLFAVFGQGAVAFYKTGWSTLMGIFLVLVYYLFFEGLWGRTPGKMILGTVVTDLQGKPPTFGAVVKRSFARFVPFEAFTFFGESGFHDKVSKTRVIYTR